MPLTSSARSLTMFPTPRTTITKSSFLVLEIQLFVFSPPFSSQSVVYCNHIKHLQLLVLEPEKRLTACLALSHPWLTSAGVMIVMKIQLMIGVDMMTITMMNIVVIVMIIEEN